MAWVNSDGARRACAAQNEEKTEGFGGMGKFASSGGEGALVVELWQLLGNPREFPSEDNGEPQSKVTSAGWWMPRIAVSYG